VPKATVLALVDTVGRGQADATAAERYYRDVVFDAGRIELATELTLVPATAGDADYALPSGAVRLLGVFFDDVALLPVSLRELEATNPQWRDEVGAPVAYVTEGETVQTFRLYPAPDVNSKSFIPVFGEPTGRDFPLYNLAILHTEIRDDYPEWTDLVFAFGVLAREFARESNHRDPVFAAACHQVFTSLIEVLA
jgi:hypothetical protein